jgi:NAD(P)-dependent dehydrogenase (short-subunit alcohol dehydrogenase family)
MYDKNGLKGKVAIISGGAGGIGMAVCKLLKERSCKIAMFDISDEAMAAARKELGMDEDSLLCFNVDIGNKSEVQSAVKTVAEKFGQVNLLINNAGGSTASKLQRGSDGKPEPTPMLEDESEEVWDKMMDVNFKGYYLCSQAAAPYMKKTGGSIVSLCSKVARSGRKTGGAGYVSAKAGVIGLTRQLAVELGPYNINANAIAPGIVNTERALKNWNAPGRETPESRKEILDSIPLRRIPGDNSREAIGAWPEDIANVILFLCSNEGSYITGVTLDVNGGWYFS